MKKLLILGDSTVQWMRPYRNHKDEFTYVELLEKEGFKVDVISLPGMTSKEVMDAYWNQLGAKFYDVYIVSVGINDLTPRSYTRWMWKINNSLLIKETSFTKVYALFYRVFTNKYIQKSFSKYKVSRPWISKRAFRAYLNKFQELVLKESDSKVIYLSLPMVSQRVSTLLDGIESNVTAYKKEIESLVDNDRVFEIDIDKLFENDRDKYNVEGIHYTADGHREVFKELIEKIESIK
jgi:lysophospholipase L1-like esterase